MNILKYNPFDGRIYKARKKNNIFSLGQAPVPQEEAPPSSLPFEREVGYLSVSVFTASGALPVQDALVTVYIRDESGAENEIIHYITDTNGQIPLITLPVIYDRFDPFASGEFYFTTYNLRVQAINYYTVNVIDLRIFPDTTTHFQIEMIPAATGPVEGPDTTIVIPPSPIDISNG